MRGFDLDPVDEAFDDAAVFADALRLEQIEAEGDILGRHRRAVGKGHIVTQVEGHEGQVGGIFQRGAKQAIGAIGVVVDVGQHAFAADGVQRGGDAVAGILVEAVKAALRPKRDFAPFRRVGIDVVQMGEIGRVFQRAKVGKAVGDGHISGRPCPRQRRYGQRADRDCRENPPPRKFPLPHRAAAILHLHRYSLRGADPGPHCFAEARTAGAPDSSCECVRGRHAKGRPEGRPLKR